MNDQSQEQPGPSGPQPGYPDTGYPRYPSLAPAPWVRYWQFLKRLWMIPVLTVTLGLCGAAVYTALQPPSYISTARMWVSGKLRMQENSLYSEELQFYFGTQVELLQSDKLRQAAQARVQALSPNLLPSRVMVQAVQAPKSSMFILRATGDDRAYTQVYLNALLDEYLNYKKQVRATTSDETLTSLSEQVFQHEKDLKAEQEKLSLYQRENNLAVLQDQGTAAGAYFGKLNSQLSDLKLERQFLESMATDMRANPSGTNQVSAANPSALSGSTFSSASASPELASARQQLQVLRLQREELSPFLRPNHPKMQRLDEEIARGEKLMVMFQKQNRDSVRDQIEPARQSLQLKMDAVQESIKEWEAKLLDANRRIAEFDKLKAGVARIQGVYDKLVNLLQSVDVNKSLDQEIVSVMEKASPARPTKPSLPKALGMASVGGLAAGLALILVFAKFDDRFTSMHELLNHFDEEIIGQVPNLPHLKRHGTVKLVEPDDERHMFAESYRNIRSSVLFMPSVKVKPKLLLVTSAVPNEGKSTVAANLARTMAFGGARVLLVDADLHKGRLHKGFGIEPGKGLSVLLREAGKLDDYIVQTDLPSLYLLPGGEPIRDASERFLTNHFYDLLAEATQRFDQVIIDSPPVFAADDAPTMAPKMDGVIFVVRSGFTRARVAREALEVLYQRQSNILGLVYNRANSTSGSYYYYKYQEYYGSAATKKAAKA